MTRLPTKFLVAALLVAVAVAGAVGALAAQQDAEPGKPATARFYILNRTAAEAVPVTTVGTVAASVAASVAAPVAIDLTPATVAALTALRDARPAWEYREIAVDQSFERGQIVPALAAAGREGWEVCGVIALASGRQGVLLKRAVPR
jgi:hypothetical protein